MIIGPFEIDDKHKDRRLFLVSGVREVVARKHPDEEWEIKVESCNQCGECCLQLTPKHHPFPVDDEGVCSMLERNGSKKWDCRAGAKAPFMCVVYPVNSQLDCCVVKYKKESEG